jgi:hypothetical protein
MAVAQIAPMRALVTRIGDLVDQADAELLAIYEELDDAITNGGTFEACYDARTALMNRLAPLLKQLRTETALGPCADAANAR